MSKQLTYAGIGSRETPPEFLKLFRDVASHLARKGHHLNSGGAPGADQAFEAGHAKVQPYREDSNGRHLKRLTNASIYLPWKGFENNDSPYYSVSQEAMELASRFHPAWNRLSDGAKKLQARNCYQVLGSDLDSPVDFIICWTPNGSGSGGTGQALRLARHFGIKVFDAGRYKTMPEAHKALKEFLEKIEA